MGAGGVNVFTARSGSSVTGIGNPLDQYVGSARPALHRARQVDGGGAGSTLVLEDPAGNGLSNNVSSSTYTNFDNLTVNSGNWRLTDGPLVMPSGAVTLKAASPPSTTTAYSAPVSSTRKAAASLVRFPLDTGQRHRAGHGWPDDERRQPARPVRQAVRHGRPDRRGHRPGHAGRGQRLQRRHHRPDRRHLAGRQRQPARQHSQQRPAILHAVQRRHLWRCPVRYRHREQERRGHADADRREHSTGTFAVNGGTLAIGAGGSLSSSAKVWLGPTPPST